MAVTINSKELLAILDATPPAENIMLVGKHGIGKSEILSNYFQGKGKRVVTLFLGQMSDPGDLIGLPNKNSATGQTEFMPPYWFPLDGQPIVLFLDELNRARPEVLQTIMDLALNRKLAGRLLPEGSQVISAVNEGEEYQLTDLDPALVSRFNIYSFRPTAQEWLLWAEQHKLDARVIAFIDANKSFLDGDDTPPEAGLDKHPDRRAWKRISDLILNKHTLTETDKKLLAGVVGMQATVAFFKTLDSNQSLSGKEAMLHFAKYKKRIEALKLHELALLNEAIFRYLETEGYNDQKNASTIAQALQAYVQLLQDKKRSEAFAHWISLYNSGNYPQVLVLILNKLPKLYGQIQSFISSL